jgi:hypothetical protein
MIIRATVQEISAKDLNSLLFMVFGFLFGGRMENGEWK